MTELMREREELDLHLRELEGRMPAKVSSRVFWGVIVLIGLAAATALYATGIAGLPFYPLLFAGSALALSVPILAGWKLRREGRIADLQSEKRLIEEKRGRTTREIAAAENERRGMIQHIHRTRSAAEKIATDILGNPRADEREIVAAEKRSAEAEGPTNRRRVLEDALKADLTDLELEEGRCVHIRHLMDEAAADLDRLEKECSLLMTEDGIGTNASPETALALILRLRELKKEIRRIEQFAEALSIMEQDWRDFSERARVLGLELGVPAGPEHSPLDRVEQWANALSRAREILAQKKEFLARTREREIHLDVSKRRMKEAEDRVAALMERAGAPNEEAFRELSVHHARYCRLRQEEQLLIAGLMSGLGVTDDAGALGLLEAQDWNENRDAEAGLESELLFLRAEVEELASAEGKLTHEIEVLEQEDETEELLAEREVLLSRFNRLAKEWLTLKVALRLLEKTLRLYESEKQPRVLERGSGLFKSITSGMFTKVLFPLEEDRIKAERRDGSRTNQDLLSRGTLEQVYLSLRLAYLDVYHRDESIPLIMDEVLVNFDPERSGRAAETLVGFSEEAGCQVLFFTCHPHIARLFPGTIGKVDLEYYFQNRVEPSVVSPFPMS